MTRFIHAHATHPQWHMAARLVLAPLRAQIAARAADFAAAPGRAVLGLVYLSDYFAAQAADLMALLNEQLPGVSDWAGSVGVGVLASGAEYIDEPALAVMLCPMPRAQLRVFSSEAPLPAAGDDGFVAHSALIHADSATPDLAARLGTLARRTGLRASFGGIASSRSEVVHIAASGADQPSGRAGAGRGGVLAGAELSGVAFGPGRVVVSRIAHGCRALARERVVTAVQGDWVLTLDDEPALDVMLTDLGVNLHEPAPALRAVRLSMAALAPVGGLPARFAGQLADDAVVRRIVAVDPAQSGIALSQPAQRGQRLTFCQPDAATARAELRRIGAELREALEPDALAPDAVAARLAAQAAGAPTGAPGEGAAPGAELGIAGAIYISCASRGSALFGSPGAEMQCLRQALGDVPLIGFLAGGEILDGRLHAHSGVLTLLLDDDTPAPRQ